MFDYNSLFIILTVTKPMLNVTWLSPVFHVIYYCLLLMMLFAVSTLAPDANGGPPPC